MEAETTTGYLDYLLGNYGEPPLTLTRGEGCRIWDADGRAYLDFGTGIAVCSIGHCHPKWVEAVHQQSETLVHCSNLFATPRQLELAQKLSAYISGGRWMFCNSGSEANEALIKLARLYGKQASNASQCYEIITASNGFHGRTYGSMSATPQPKIQNGFEPLVPGFKVATLNDIESFERCIDDQTAAVLIEPIQGEGGIHVAETSFLKELRSLCTEKNLLLLIDEVQCGCGRTGHFFAHAAADIRPDGLSLAKGLGGGFPIGAVWIEESCAELFTPGSHGTTYGGNPLACAAALAVIETIEDDDLLKRVQDLSNAYWPRLQQLVEDHPHALITLRGSGYMIGLVCDGCAKPLAKALREKGLITIPAGENVLRLLPPLNISEDEWEEALSILNHTLKSLSNENT